MASRPSQAGTESEPLMSAVTEVSTSSRWHTALQSASRTNIVAFRTAVLDGSDGASVRMDSHFSRPASDWSCLDTTSFGSRTRFNTSWKRFTSFSTSLSARATLSITSNDHRENLAFLSMAEWNFAPCWRDCVRRMGKELDCCLFFCANRLRELHEIGLPGTCCACSTSGGGSARPAAPLKGHSTLWNDGSSPKMTWLSLWKISSTWPQKTKSACGSMELSSCWRVADMSTSAFSSVSTWLWMSASVCSFSSRYLIRSESHSPFPTESRFNVACALFPPPVTISVRHSCTNDHGLTLHPPKSTHGGSS
mmetsp:Transcript_41131/g.97601  ORF Transcript_41131/g.97601 Transcript_41131/m.97601 type:complete len:308 (+) Transcript_41131:1796-2719(+)